MIISPSTYTRPSISSPNVPRIKTPWDRHHNSDYIRTALNRTLVEGVGLSIDFTDEVKLLNTETLSSGYRMLIIFRDANLWPEGYGETAFYGRGGEPVPIESEPPIPESEIEGEAWMTDEQGEAVRAFVQRGGVALLYHNVTYIASGNQPFREVLGAATEGHPPVRRFKVEITDRDHPITRGVNDSMVTDEQHFMTFDKDPDFILMRSVNEDGHTFRHLGTTCEAGWAFDYGKGRVCYLAPGHLIPVLWNPEYVKIQQNAVKWLLGDPGA